MLHADRLARYTPHALSVVRIVTALIFMEHGTQKLLGFPPPAEVGSPPFLSLLWIGGLLESSAASSF